METHGEVEDYLEQIGDGFDGRNLVEPCFVRANDKRLPVHKVVLHQFAPPQSVQCNRLVHCDGFDIQNRLCFSMASTAVASASIHVLNPGAMFFSCPACAGRVVLTVLVFTLKPFVPSSSKSTFLPPSTFAAPFTRFSFTLVNSLATAFARI